MEATDLKEEEGQSEHESEQKPEEETFVAVKVVSALGSLDDYKSQVDALQKEYRLVTELGNHPRIIQFFAIKSMTTGIFK